MDLVIFTGAKDKTQAAVVSATDTTPVSDLEMLVVGDQPTLTVTFTDGASAPSWAGDPSYILTVGLGNLDTGGNAGYTGTSAFSSITSGWTGVLPLNTQALVDALSLAVGSAVDWTRFPTQARIPFPRPSYGYFFLQIKVTNAATSVPVTYANLRVCVLNRVLPAYISNSPTGGGSTPVSSGSVQSGTVSLTAGNVSKVIAFPTSFTLLPSVVAVILMPSGGDIIACSPDYSTLSVAGVTIQFAAAIPASGYKLAWFANA